MTKAIDTSEIEAIKQVIAEGGAMDYVDVVDAVERRFQVKTSAAKVEQVHRDMARARMDSKPSSIPRMKIGLTAKLPSDVERDAMNSGSMRNTQASDAPIDETAIALQFVRTMGGMNKARRALDDLETVLRN